MCEAISKVEHEGRVDYVPRRGTIVVGLSAEDVADAYQLRAHLGGYGGGLAATRATADDLERLLELIKRISGLRVSDMSLEQLAERDWPIVAALQSRNAATAESISRGLILELGERVLAGFKQSATDRVT